MEVKIRDLTKEQIKIICGSGNCITCPLSGRICTDHELVKTVLDIKINIRKRLDA